MTATARYDFQQECLLRVKGKVLNAGCKEDPAGLKQMAPDRVVNLDMRDYDHDLFYNHGQLVPIPVDVVHDITDIPWPFADDEFDLVVLAEILEDLPDDGCQLEVLREAHRVSQAVCITCPEDTPERDWHHQTTITAARLRDWLDTTGWVPLIFQIRTDYPSVPRGYWTFAVRKGTTRML